MRLLRGIPRGTSLLFSLAACLSPLCGSGVTDLGPVPADTPQTASIIFKVRQPEALAQFIAQSVDPGSWGFRQFLSTQAFAQAFGPANADFYQVLYYLGQQGLTVNEVYDSHMVIRATGTTAQFNALLATELHTYTDGVHRFQKPNCKPQVPVAIQDLVLLVAGMDTELATHAHSLNAAVTADWAGKEPAPMVTLPAKGATATGVPGSFTVGDVANLYNLNPLYASRITGKGRTLGIATLASFTQADAYAYWSAVGLTVDPDRITEIPVDGGTGTDGAGETTLDVEQAGGLAYQAKILVYEAPNTFSGFLDLFYKAVSDNRVDTLSTSWGDAEAVLDGETLQAYDQAFMEAAAQGIPVFAAAGDNGAFDLNGDFPTPYYSATNSVDSPASDPYITAAGGLTLPVAITFKHGTVTVPQVRPWGWDYLKPYIAGHYGEFYYDYNFFPVGGGGGVSFTAAAPAWQEPLNGVQPTPAAFSTLWFYPNYTATDPDTSGAVDEGALPAGYAGRNVPDLALNADPYTGYLLYVGGAFQAGWGGTSFVAPQLNGIASLLTQANGGRVGFLNPQLYRLFQQYRYGHGSPFQAITTGDNLFWSAEPGYNPASGLGALDATRLAELLAAAN